METLYEFTKTDLTAAFNEWYNKQEANPDKYWNRTDKDCPRPPEYGQCCADELLKCLNK